MNDTKKHIIDLIVALGVVFVVIAILLPMFFPYSPIDPFGLGKDKEHISEEELPPPVDIPQSDPADEPTKPEEPTNPPIAGGEIGTEVQTPAEESPSFFNKLFDRDWGHIFKVIMYVAIGIAILGITGYGVLYISRLHSYKSLAKEMVYFKVMPASDYKLPNIAYAKYFLINLSKHLQSPWDPMFLSTPWCRVIYKKKMEDGNIEMVIGVPKDRTDGFISSFKAYYTKVQLIDYFEIYEDKHGNKYRITSPTELLDDEGFSATEFRLKYNKGDESLSPIHMFARKPDEMDPLETLAASMGAGEVDMDEVIVDITLKPVWSKRYLYDKGRKYIDKMRGNQGGGNNLTSILQGAADELTNSKSSGNGSGKRPILTEYTRAAMQQIKIKCSPPERAYATNIRAYMKCKNPEHLTMKLKGVADGFDALSDLNELETESVYNKKNLWERIYLGYPHPMKRMILSTAELVSFVRVLDSTSPMFTFFDHNDTMAIRAPSGFWEDDTIEYEDMD